MALNANLLTSHPECDETLVDIDAELDTHQHHDDNLDYADRQTGRVVSSVVSRLAGVNARIASYTTTLAQPNLDAATRSTTEDQLLTANYQQTRLTKRAAARTGAIAFLADLDAEQVAKQVEVLTNARALVVVRRAELPA